MANESGNVPVPPPAGPTVKKSHVGLIVGAVVVVGVLWMMVGGGHSGGGTGGTTTAADTETTTASGGNPLFGKWSLVDPVDAAYCPSTEEFTASKSKWTQNGTEHQMKPIYDIQQGGQKVNVGYGDSYIGNWTVIGPDDLQLGQVGPPPYGVATFCKYHRM